jgi:hypothetical protein
MRFATAIVSTDKEGAGFVRRSFPRPTAVRGCERSLRQALRDSGGVPWRTYQAPPPPEGPPKKKSTDPPVHLLNLRPTHPPSDFFFLTFSLVRFWAFLGKGVQKHHTNILEKVRVENFSQNFDKNFDVSFSSTFLFYHILECFSAMGVQKHYKKRFAKKIVSKNAVRSL